MKNIDGRSVALTSTKVYYV